MWRSHVVSNHAPLDRVWNAHFTSVSLLISPFLWNSLATKALCKHETNLLKIRVFLRLTLRTHQLLRIPVWPNKASFQKLRRAISRSNCHASRKPDVLSVHTIFCHLKSSICLCQTCSMVQVMHSHAPIPFLYSDQPLRKSQLRNAACTYMRQIQTGYVARDVDDDLLKGSL